MKRERERGKTLLNTCSAVDGFDLISCSCLLPSWMRCGEGGVSDLKKTKKKDPKKVF